MGLSSPTLQMSSLASLISQSVSTLNDKDSQRLADWQRHYALEIVPNSFLQEEAEQPDNSVQTIRTPQLLLCIKVDLSL